MVVVILSGTKVKARSGSGCFAKFQVIEKVGVADYVNVFSRYGV
jgi:hypothetical protein